MRQHMPSAMIAAAVVAIAVLFVPCAHAVDWSGVDKVLNDAIADQVFPGCVAGVAVNGKTVYLQAHGKFTYGVAPPKDPGTVPTVTTSTLFDLASLTKVTATTSAVATFYQRGELDLNEPIASDRFLGPGYGNNGKDVITPLNLLLHNAGYPPDPVPNYWDPEFKCPNTASLHPAEDFSCVQQCFSSLLNQTLINPVGAKYVYSDLSMITLQFVVGGLARDLGYITPDQLLPSCGDVSKASEGLSRSCYYEAYVRHYVLAVAKMASTSFLPDPSLWPYAMPTWNDTDYLHEVIQGQVSDGNSYALGGIAGHAGLFSTVPDLLRLMNRIMYAPDAPTDGFLNSTTVTLFTTVHNVTQSSRALGWDTNNYQANTYRGCSNLASTTFTHTGYTGTQVCNDPTRNLTTVLFTNRVYPDKTGQSGTVHTTRQHYNDAVLAALT